MKKQTMHAANVKKGRKLGNGLTRFGMTSMNNVWALLLSLTMVLISLPVSVTGQALPSRGAVALTNVTIIDGNGGRPKANQTIIIRDGLITDLFTTGRKRLDKGVTVMDMTGRFVIPGLVDSHVHLTAGPRTEEEFKASLSSALLGGLTSVRDMGGDGITLAEKARAARDVNVLSPRIYFSSIMAGPSWFTDPRARASAHGLNPGEQAWLRSISATTDIPKAISEAKATGATGIKMYADLPPDLVRKLTAEAHRQGLKVWSHATIFPSKPRDALLAGVDVLSHSALLAYEGMDRVPESYRANRGAVVGYEAIATDSEAMTKLLTGMRRGTILDATLFVTGQLAKPSASTANLQDARLAWTYEITRRAHRLGVTIAAGTDGMGRGMMPNIHTEMELLVSKCGLTPLEAITAATRNGARALGVEKYAGTIEVGKIADLVVLDADPSVDINNTRRIICVVKGGALHSRRETTSLLNLPDMYRSTPALWFDQAMLPEDEEHAD